MPRQNKNLIVNVHLEYWLIKWHIVSPTLTCALLQGSIEKASGEKSRSFLCAHWSFMWFYDDILIKAICHGVGTVIKNIPTHRGFITALFQQMEDARKEDKRMMNAGTNLNVPHCSSGLNFGGRLTEDALLCCHLTLA